MIFRRYMLRLIPIVILTIFSTVACAEINNIIERDEAMNQGFDKAIEGDLEAAIFEFEKAINLDPDYAPAYDARGTALLEEGELDQAITDFNQAIELEDETAIFYVDRGLAYLRKAEIDRALSDFNQAIELNDHEEITALSFRNRGELYMIIGENDQAIADFQAALELTSDPALKEGVESFLEQLGKE